MVPVLSLVCSIQGIIKSTNKTDQYCPKSILHNVLSLVSHLNTDQAFGFEIEGVAAAIGLIYREYFRDEESAQTQNKQMALFFPLSASAVQMQDDLGILITFSKARRGEKSDAIHSSPLPAENAIIFTDRRKTAAKTRGRFVTATRHVPCDPLPGRSHHSVLWSSCRPDHHSLTTARGPQIGPLRRGHP